MGYSPQSHKESDTSERLIVSISHSQLHVYLCVYGEMNIYMLITIWFRHQYRNSEF